MDRTEVYLTGDVDCRPLLQVQMSLKYRLHDRCHGRSRMQKSQCGTESAIIHPQPCSGRDRLRLLTVIQQHVAGLGFHWATRGMLCLMNSF